MNAGRRLVLFSPLLAVAGCAPPTYHARLETLPRAGGVVLMPPDIELSEVSAGGVHEPKAEWTAVARVNLDAALDAERQQRGLTMTRFDDSKLDPLRRAELDQIQNLHGAVGRAILRYQFTPNQGLPTKQGRFDWTLGTAARDLRQATGADHALFIWIRDSYASAGRAAVQVLAAIAGAVVGVAVILPGGAQVGFASLVDLDSGDIVWFNRLARTSGDLRTPPAAIETAKVLLSGFPK